MKLCLLFLVLTPVFCSRAAKPTGQEPALVSVPCNDPVAGSIAYLSLRQLNANRKEGSVFTLHRISNVQEHFNEETGSVYYLVLDVLETDCHVLSLRLLDDCKPKPFNKALFGQCKVTFQLNKPRRIAHLHNYDCTLQPVSRIPDSSPEYDVEAQEIAKQSLEKFNKVSDYSKYFVLGNITRATKKDDAYFVEFTILESSCNKTNPQGEQCEPLDCEFAHSGYCSVVFPADNLTVHCDVFEPEAAILEEQRHQDGHAQDKPDQSDQRPHQGNRGERGKKHEHSHHKHGHKHSKKHEHKHGHKHDHKHHHKHDHKHDDHDDSESHEHEHEHEHLHQYEHHHTPTKGGHGPPEDPRKTVGIIRILNPGLQPSAAPKEKGNKGKKPSGDTKTVPSVRPGSRPFILPFPEKASTSDQCPGQPEKVVNTGEAPNQPTSIPK